MAAFFMPESLRRLKTEQPSVKSQFLRKRGAEGAFLPETMPFAGKLAQGTGRASLLQRFGQGARL